MSEYNDLKHWYSTPPGSWLAEWEQEITSSILPNLKGHCCIQIGGLNHYASFRGQKYVFQSTWDPTEPNAVLVNINSHVLPLQPSSVDALIIVHVLEQMAHPIKMLRETYDALKPGGYLLIFGFNPWSLWGMYKLFSPHSDDFPGRGKFWSRAHLKRWLMHYGYTILKTKTFCFYPPLKKTLPLRLMRVNEILGQFIFPMNGGVYFIMAQKRIAVSWKEKWLKFKNRMVVRNAFRPNTRA